MRFRIVYLLVMTVLCLSATAQDWSGDVYRIGKIYPGYYVTMKGDTVQGYFYHGNQAGNQKECRYYVQETDKKPKAVFKPGDIKAWKVGDKEYHAIHYSGGLTKKPLRFNLVIVPGAITQYNFYAESGPPGEPDVVFFKHNDPQNPDPFAIDKFALRFSKNMSELVHDHKELAGKVAAKDKGYGLIYLERIIAEYNEWHAAQGN